jgi:large subunit ribosomal protein L24
MHIRKDDIVVVLSGDDKDVRGKVLEVDHETNKVIVEGVNKVFKHMRKSQKNPQGGRLQREAPIPVSKVMLIDPKSGKPCRTGVRYLADGSKERFNRKDGKSISVIAPARKRYAKKA